MALAPAKKQEIISTYGKSAVDTGSPESQIAMLSQRISDLTEHLKSNANERGGRRGLLLLVGRRRRLLQYLEKIDIERYRSIVDRLSLRR